MAPDDVQCEGARNALLRRVDWRLLLPCPRPQRAVNRARGALGAAVRLISAKVYADPRCQSDCDLVVDVDPGTASCDAAYTALAPGGWFYAEWRVPFRARPARVRRLLENAGFVDVACYWRWLAAANPRAWLPLEAPGAWRFWQMRCGSRHPVRRTARSLLRFVAQRGALLFPICAIGRRPADPSSPIRHQDRHLFEMISERWPQWGLGDTPGRLSCLLVTGGNRCISKCVALIFEEPHAQPRLAVKLSRVPQSIPALQQEATVLQTLHSDYPAACSGIPRVLHSERGREHALLVETAIPGVPIEKMIERGSFQALALKGTDWLAEFARQTARGPGLDWRTRLAQPAIEEFATTFQGVADARLLEYTREILGTLNALPTLPEQRDFSPWNVLLDPQGALVVLDWESAELNGVPALDLIYFMTYLAFALDNVPIETVSPRLRESYRRSLDPTTFTGRIRRACMARYAARVGLDLNDVQRLAILAWLIHSRSDYRRFSADFPSRPRPSTLRQSVFLALWEEEVRNAIAPRRTLAAEGALADRHARTGVRSAYRSDP